MKNHKTNDKSSNIEKNITISICDVVLQHLEHIKITKKSNNYEIYIRFYQRLLNHVGDIPIKSIKKKPIEMLLRKVSRESYIRKKDNKETYLMLKIYRSLFNYAIIKNDLIMINPCYGIKIS
jgi:uncharacterized protein (DUF1499 family)